MATTITTTSYMSASATVSNTVNSGLTHNNKNYVIGAPDSQYAGFAASAGDTVTFVDSKMIIVPADATINSIRFTWTNDESINAQATARIWYNATAYGQAGATFRGNTGVDLIMTGTPAITPEVVNNGSFQLIVNGTSSRRRLDSLLYTITYTTNSTPVQRTVDRFATVADMASGYSGYTTLSGPPENALGSSDGKYFGVNNVIDPTVTLRLSGFDFTTLPPHAVIDSASVAVYKNAKLQTGRLYRSNAYAWPDGSIATFADQTQLGSLQWDLPTLRRSDLKSPLAVDLMLDGNSPDNLMQVDAVRIRVTYTEFTSGPTSMRWDGTQWVSTSFARRWDGSQWVDAKIVRY